MRSSARTSSFHSRQVAIFAAIAVVLFIIFSLVIKTVKIVLASTFDGQHQYILQAIEQDKSVLISFTPDTKSMTIVTLSGNNAGQSAEKTIGVPVDAQIEVPSQDPKDIPNHLPFFGSIGSSFTQFDSIRLSLFAKTVNADNITTKYISLPQDVSSIDTTLTSLFTDQALYKEGKTVAIINAGGVSGGGNQIARMLGHIGCNVISVTTADSDSDVSKLLYTGAPSYSLSRFQRIFHIVGQKVDSQQIADITVIIGKDKIGDFTQ
ncbi:MAG TPA: LytR C-terminal domain-containing protein [Patescibacteria group bacterium]|nr:LytR C-terminal domain-containing protein [Patescibacteria group bacterium]